MHKEAGGDGPAEGALVDERWLSSGVSAMPTDAYQIVDRLSIALSTAHGRIPDLGRAGGVVRDKNKKV